MGLVFQATKGLISSYSEETVSWKKALVEPGKAVTDVKCAPLTAEEVEMILLKLDQMAMSVQHEGIAKMVAEEAESILLAVRMVKDETKSPFAGILGAGANLDMMWLRPKDVGDSNSLNSAGTDNKGLYKGTSGGVLTWTHSFTADTAAEIIPEQTMAEEAAVVHLGAIDPVEVPKVGAMKVTLAGIPAPAQSLPFNIRSAFGSQSVPFVRFEKPIIVGPEKTQKIELEPDITGDSKVQLMSLLIARAEKLTI